MTEPPALPESVRRRVVDVAAERLGVLAPDEVPASLRPFAKFVRGRRNQAAVPIAAALEADEDFRERVAEGLRESVPDLVAVLEEGRPAGAVDPVDAAAVAYLVRSPGWEERVGSVAAAEAAEQAARAAEAQRRAAAKPDRSLEAEARALAARAAEAERRLAKAVDDLERERRRGREAAERARRAEAAAGQAQAALEAERSAAAAAAPAAASETAVLRERVAEAEATLERLRRDTRDAREAADTRRWLLLDTLARAVAGLREELAPAPPTRRPADFVEAVDPADEASYAGGAAPEDPATVDLLLALPNAHLVVDGYNVTKSGYPDLTLADQRNRLVTGLAALAARTGAEVTCVFDGAEVQVRVPTAAARRVRVRFSPPGQTADELIRRLVRAEPAGRAVTVCSADKEVVDGVRRFGARIVAPSALLARLARA